MYNNNNNNEQQQQQQHHNETYKLSSRDIPNVSVANELFGDDTSLIVARPGRGCCNCFWFTIPEGFYALVTNHGADVDYEDGNPVWPPGLHIGPPWLKVSHLVTKQAILFNTPIRGCKTRDNVTVQIDLAIVLRIMGDPSIPGDDPHNVRKFVHEVTAEGLQQQLADAMAEGIRTLARSVCHTEVFGLRTVEGGELRGVQERLYEGRGGATVPVVEKEGGGGGGLGRASGEKSPFGSILASDSLLVKTPSITTTSEIEMTGGGGRGHLISPLSPIVEEKMEIRAPPIEETTTTTPTSHEQIDIDENSISDSHAQQQQQRQLPQPLLDDLPSPSSLPDPDDPTVMGEHDPYSQDEANFNIEHGTSVISQLKSRLNRQFQPQGVQILNVIIQRIKLPPSIHDQMSQKTMVISQNAEQRMQQKYDMLLLQQSEAIKTLKQYQMEQKMELIEDGDYQTLLQQLSLQTEREQSLRTLRNIRTQMTIDVATVDAESSRTVSRIHDATALEADRIELDATVAANKLVVQSRTRAEYAKIVAERDGARTVSEGDMAIYRAEGLAAEKMRTMNEFITRRKVLDVQDSLAGNELLVVTGSGGGRRRRGYCWWMRC